jgi:HAD superfamily hydrolase (TIGR01509 family)
MLRGLIFDFDGLILDTEGPEFRTWQEVYAGLGRALELSVWAACIGTASDAFDPCAHLETLLGHPIDREAIRDARDRRCAELIAAAPVLPGVAEYLADARRLGLGLAVASSSSRGWVTGHLDRLGLSGSFACIRSADDVERVKPDPELYRSALAALGLEPAEAIAFEDSPNGILAAKRAGLFCIAVPNPVTGELPLDAADLRLPSLASLSLEALLARVAAIRP